MATQTIPYILATAGHVDHGKSALVKALTGTDPDRLPEEKRRGITIDLGFACFRLPSPPGVAPRAEYEIGVVDVPGHEDFVKNMVAGVGSIDAALLVVAADDGWMPQTEEHLLILKYLGIRRGVVAVSKIDLIENLDAAIDNIRSRLRGTALEGAKVIPVSVLRQRGLGELKETIATLLSQIPNQLDIGKPRLPVDRVFALKGVGTVVTGTLTGGFLRRGQVVAVRGVETRIRTIQTYGRDVESAQPGARVALNLPDLQCPTSRSTRTSATVVRGDVITLPELRLATRQFDALIEGLPDREVVRHPPLSSLRHQARLYVHHGSDAVPARIYFLDPREITGSGGALVRLMLEREIIAWVGDHFVLRDWPEQQTLGGGIVLDAEPMTAASRRWRRDERWRRFLRDRAAAPDDLSTLILTQVIRDGIIPSAMLLSGSHFSRARIQTAVEQLARAGAVRTMSDLVVGPSLSSDLEALIVAAVDDWHRSHPERSGLPVADLTPMLARRLAAHARSLVPAVVEAMMVHLADHGFTNTGGMLRRSSHRPALPPRLTEAGLKIRQQLAARPFDPPSKKELCASDQSFAAVKFLIAAGEAIDVAPDLILSADAYNRAVTLIRRHLEMNDSSTVSELKSLLGSTRRVMVPLLEKLDRAGVTIRDGDRRRLGPKS